jgi:ADP-ribose pyrophosphatase YjhB (NUDIX family)
MNRHCTKCGKPAAKKDTSLYVCEEGHENWINPALGVSVFVIRGDTVLHGIRSHAPGKGKFDRPGGFVEVGETAEQAAVRESKEEFGIDINIIDFLGSHATTYEGRPALDLSFVATTETERITPGDDMAGGDPVWRKVDDLPRPDEQAAEWFEEAQQEFVAWWHARQQK